MATDNPTINPSVEKPTDKPVSAGPPTSQPTSQPTGYQSRLHEEHHDGAVWNLIRDFSNQTVRLARQEVDLAKAEMREHIDTYVRNSVYVAVGGFVAFCGLLVFLAAAVAGLYVILNMAMPWYIAAWLSPLIMGVVVAVAGYALIRKAISTFKRTSLKPEKTIDTLREDSQFIKQHMHRVEHEKA